MNIDLSVERKCRSFIKKNLGEIKGLKRIRLLKRDNLWFNVAWHILKKVLYRGTNIEIVHRKGKNVLIALPMERYDAMMLDTFLKDSKENNGIYLLSNIPEEEIIKYSKKNKIEGKVPALKRESIKLLEFMQKKHPQTFHSARKSFDFLRKRNIKKRVER